MIENDPFNRKIEVRVLRGGPCGEGATCPTLTDTGHPDYLHFIAEPETDPELLAAHAALIGPDEQLWRWPRGVGLPEVPPR